MKISGKTVVITGGASGIGAALSRRAVSLGARVCIVDRDIDRARALADELNAMCRECDVTIEDDIKAMISEVTSALGPIDVFVSNAGAGYGEPDTAASADNDIWELNWNLHVMSHVYAARALLPEMIARGSGYFVNVASAAGLLNQIGDAAYSATKHAAVSFAESLAITHGEDGIGVSVVCPQYVATPLLGLSDPDAAERENLLTADDVAAEIVVGIQANRFLILPHPVVRDYASLRATDHDRWINGMRSLRAKAKAKFGSARPQDLFKLV